MVKPLARILALGLALVPRVHGLIQAQERPPLPRPAPRISASAGPVVVPNWGLVPTLNDPDPSSSVRFPLLPSPAPALDPVLQPSPEAQRDYARFIERTVSPENILQLILGRPKLIIFKLPPKRAQLPSDTIVDLQLISETEYLFTGRQVGTTVLNLWFDDPERPDKERILSLLVRVESSPDLVRLSNQLQEQLLDGRKRAYRTLAQEINCAFPDSVVELNLFGETLVLSGQARDAEEADKILQLVTIQAPRVERRVIQPSNFALILNDPRYAGADLRGLLTIESPSLINMLRVPGEQQVMLRVVTAEVNRTALRTMGINFSLFSNQGLNYFSQLTGAGFTNNLPLLLDGGQVIFAIGALREVNLAKTLSEPTLTTLNGQPATFQAGGSFPVPLITGATATGLQGVSFVPFGVQVSFTPVITDKDRIRLTLDASVSTRDLSTAASIGGTNVSGLAQRQFTTTVEMREGQTLAVAGLIQTSFGGNGSRVPWLGEVPILGQFFNAQDTSASEQELIILVTPELVHPLEPKQVLGLPLPGDDLKEPGDLEFFLLGRLTSLQQTDFRSPVRTDLARIFRYLHCEDRFLYGPRGHSDGRPPIILPRGHPPTTVVFPPRSPSPIISELPSPRKETASMDLQTEHKK